MVVFTVELGYHLLEKTRQKIQLRELGKYRANEIERVSASVDLEFLQQKAHWRANLSPWCLAYSHRPVSLCDIILLGSIPASSSLKVSSMIVTKQCIAYNREHKHEDKENKTTIYPVRVANSSEKRKEKRNHGSACLTLSQINAPGILNPSSSSSCC